MSVSRVYAENCLQLYDVYFFLSLKLDSLQLVSLVVVNVGYSASDLESLVAT